MIRFNRFVVMVALFTGAPALCDGAGNFDWNRMPRCREVPKMYGDPIVAGSSDLFSAKWDDDVVISTPRGPFALTRTYAGVRNALGQTSKTALTRVCREGVVGSPWPGLLKSPYGGNLVRQDGDVQREPITLNSLTSIVDVNCGTHTRVLTTEGDTRFFAPLPTLSNGQSAWVARAAEATAEPSRLKVIKSNTGTLSFEWHHEDGRRFIYNGLYPAWTGVNGQYRLFGEYASNGLLFYEVTYGYPTDTTAQATLWDGGVKKYFSDPSPTAMELDGGCDSRTLCLGVGCVDTKWSSQRCGSCGTQCAATQYCVAGACRAISAPCEASLEPLFVSFPGTKLQLKLVYQSPPSANYWDVEYPTSECVLKKVVAVSDANEELLVEYNYVVEASLVFSRVTLADAVFSPLAGPNAWRKLQPTAPGRSWQIGFTEVRPNWLLQDLESASNTEHTVAHVAPTESDPETVMKLYQESQANDMTAKFTERQDVEEVCTNCCQPEATARVVDVNLNSNPSSVTASVSMAYYTDKLRDGGVGIPDWNSDFDALPIARFKVCATTSSLFCQDVTETYHYGRAGLGHTPSELNVCSATNRPVVLLARGLDNGGYEQRDVRVNSSTSMLEIRSTREGASSPTASDALRTTSTQYSYGTQEQQFAEQTSEPSVLGGVAATTTVVRVDDEVVSVVRSGSTMVEGTVVQRHIATFYRQTRPCSSGTAEKNGRVRAIVGPCEVSGPSATSCIASTFRGGGVTVSQPIPVTEFFYYGGDELPVGVTEDELDAFNSGRVALVRRFAGGCSGGIDTVLGSYSALGNPGKITGPNADVSQFTWQGALMTHAILPDANQYDFEWDRGRITKVTRPEGDSTIYCTQKAWPLDHNPICIRTVLGGSGFSVNLGHRSSTEWTEVTPSPILNRQTTWIAEVAKPPGKRTTRLEHFVRDNREELIGRRLFGTYSPAGVGLIDNWASFCDPNAGGGDCMSRTDVTNDFQRSPVASNQGISGTGGHTSIRYDPSGAVSAAGAGLDFMQTSDPLEPYCKTNGSDDPRCTYFSRDRLSRLVGARWSLGSQEDCLAYDAQGNISVVARGCSNGNGAGGKSVCPSNTITTTAGVAVIGGPTCGERIEYIWDDFGRLVAMNRPAGSGTSRTTYEYNPSGQLVKKQTTTQATASEVSWTKRDGLGRVVESSVSKDDDGDEVDDGDIVVLTSRQWDAAPAAVSGCLASFPASPNQKGRLAYSQDPVWDTWYAYDSLGRVVAERRVDRVEPVCTGDGDVQPKYNTTRYAYTPNGNLAQMVYPSGRQISYEYDDDDGEIDNNMPTGVSMSFRNMSDAWLVLPIVTDVKWTADKRLKSYGFKNYTSIDPYVVGEETLVEFEYSRDDLENRPSSCGQSVEGNDGTGRLRRMRVTDNTNKSMLYERWYTWRADQVVSVDVCYGEERDPLNEINAMEPTAFDALKRLKSNSVVPWVNETSQWNNTAREYSYDLLGNRTFEHVYEPTWGSLSGWQSLYAGGSQLVRREAASSLGVPLTFPGAETTYEYDADGRQIRRNAGLNSSNVPNASVSYGFPASSPHSGGGIGEALRTVELDGDDTHQYTGLIYKYFYDIDNKRIRKEYPESSYEDYFYDLQKHLIAERSFAAFGSRDNLVWDEYIYLGGVPVAAIRSAVDARGGSYTPIADLDGFDGDVCPRRGVWGHCALTQLVADYQSRPVLAVSNLHEITGVGEYDAFGFRNRVSLPAATVSNGADVTGLGKLPVGGLDSDFRLVRVRRSPSPRVIAAALRSADGDTRDLGGPST